MHLADFKLPTSRHRNRITHIHTDAMTELHLIHFDVIQIVSVQKLLHTVRPSRICTIQRRIWAANSELIYEFNVIRYSVQILLDIRICGYV